MPPTAKRFDENKCSLNVVECGLTESIYENKPYGYGFLY